MVLILAEVTVVERGAYQARVLGVKVCNACCVSVLNNERVGNSVRVVYRAGELVYGEQCVVRGVVNIGIAVYRGFERFV